MISLVLYVRVSSLQQSGSGHVSIDVQKASCVSWAAEHGATIIDTIEHIGSAYNEDNLVTLSSYIKRKHPTANGVLVYQITRLSRNIGHYTSFCKRMGSNFYVHSVLDNTATTSPMGEYHISAGILHGQLDSTMISERVKLSQKFKRDLGGHIGKPPYGMCHEQVDVQVEPTKTVKIMKLRPCAEEREVIRFVKQHYHRHCTPAELTASVHMLTATTDYERVELLENDDLVEHYSRPIDPITYDTIADILNDFGVTKRGKQWTASSVAHVYRIELPEQDERNLLDGITQSMGSCELIGLFPGEEMYIC